MKTSITRQSTFILSPVFSVYCCYDNLTYFYVTYMFYVITYLYHEETALEIETINFTIESLVFHNRHLMGFILSQI